ncbi:OPT family oligopeptide transporter [Gluconacetobacter diazotrophicus]|uniref:Putative oligopeptide transporter n=1 Tax=Gluconacetobacter diazotrophicus (strain ATCC 49037 / DSM 5601 / CCUG 37298 / CIP 103539 / LMG 7603 / PAl5) TaxID=272568 RepID=A9HS98_GLUDA|nr:oligopeptide transporter, OPT family [Gluconacetobacter diazotrophicus]CAP57047.1 putative oligopeptide transporter [Gluconacetobacter diazotrophicus PA1 5]
MTDTTVPLSRPAAPSAEREMTIRGLVLGALITIVFTASNIYLGLKIGLTVASSIPAAVISMSVLRTMGGATILENNLVQTQASAAGTLSCVFISFPCLVMIGHWQHFPYLETTLLSLAGGMTGVLFTVPLRRAMVTHSSLPYPEGVAAAEILKAGSEGGNPDSLKALMTGGLVSAVVTFATGGLRLLSDGASATAVWGGAVFRASTGFSLALLGAGYLVGIAGGLAMLVGAIIAWGIAVPVLSTMLPNTAHLAPAAFATQVWAQKVRFMGAGTIGVAAIWTLAMLAQPVAAGIRDMLRAGRSVGEDSQSRDLSPRTMVLLTGVSLAILFGLFVAFQAPIMGAPGAAEHAIIGAALAAVLFCALFGFLIAAACGYMAGIVGSSSSPLSGIAIIAVVMIALFLLGLEQVGLLPAQMSANGHHLAIAFALFILSAIVASSAISNDNLQDLKTGQLVGASPWRQQAALLVGCISGAVVIPPVLELLYQAYGFVGAMPRAGMNPDHALAAPQPALLVTIATGIFQHQLDWNMIVLGAGLGGVLIAADLLLRRWARALPPLAVGIGLYLPPAVSVTLAIGAVLGWACTRRRPSLRAETGIGTMLASGFIVGESLTGVLLAAVAGATGRDDTLSVLPAGADAMPMVLGFLVFVAICTWFGRSIRRV